MATFNTVAQAVNTYRTQVWGQAKAKDCGYRAKADGGCTTFTFQIGNVTWKAYFDNYGRATTERV